MHGALPKRERADTPLIKISIQNVVRSNYAPNVTTGICYFGNTMKKRTALYFISNNNLYAMQLQVNFVLAWININQAHKRRNSYLKNSERHNQQVF